MPEYIRNWDDATLITNTIDYPGMLLRLPWCSTKAAVAAKCSIRHKHPVLFYRVMYHSEDRHVHGADPFRPLYCIKTSVLDDKYWPFHVPLCEYAAKATLVSCVQIVDVEDGHTQSFYLLPHTDSSNPYRAENTTHIFLKTVVEGADDEQMQLEEEELMKLADLATQHLDAASDRQMYDVYNTMKASYRINDIRSTDNGCLIWLSALHWSVVRRMLTVYIPGIDTDRSLVTGLLALCARAYFVSGFHQATYTPLNICTLQTREGASVISRASADAEKAYLHAFMKKAEHTYNTSSFWTIYATTIIAAFIGENEDLMSHIDHTHQKSACGTPKLQFQTIHSNIVRDFKDDLSMRSLFELERRNMPCFARAWEPLRQTAADRPFDSQSKTHAVIELLPIDSSRPFARSTRLQDCTVHLELLLSDNDSKCDIIFPDADYLYAEGILRKCRTKALIGGEKLDIQSYLKKTCVMFYPLDPKDPNCHIVLIHNSFPTIACVMHNITRNQQYGSDMERLITNGSLFSE